jgi:hypothetical protein
MIFFGTAQEGFTSVEYEWELWYDIFIYATYQTAALFRVPDTKDKGVT